MDTREKIISPTQAAALAVGAPVTAFVSHLEVLRSAHVHKIAQVAAAHQGKLFVILTDPESPLAPLDARAEVVAALRAVDYVVPAPEGAEPVLSLIRPAITVHDEAEDRARTLQLIQHVQNRSRS